MGAEKAARKFLEGLGARERKPWDEPMGDSSVKPAKPSPPAAAKPSGDSVGDQVRAITERNRDFAKRTRHLRKDY